MPCPYYWSFRPYKKQPRKQPQEDILLKLPAGCDMKGSGAYLREHDLDFVGSRFGDPQVFVEMFADSFDQSDEEEN